MEFFCKQCNLIFKKKVKNYLNYNCPKCGKISSKKDFFIGFKGLPTVKN